VTRRSARTGGTHRGAADTLGTVAGFRVALPLYRSVRHDLRVVAVYPETPGTWSVVVCGRHLETLPIAGGQFLQWRFLRRGL
jgi:hypothetical protein